MACSDDEGESLLLNVVSDYSLVDENDEPISFSELPLVWDNTERLEESRKEIGLQGTADNGLQKIFEQVVAWKFDSSSAKPEIFLLSKKKNWIKLQKPRKAFEKTIRTILITVHCLHFLKRNPETSEKALWDHLAKVFSLYEPRPCENDLVDHMNLIGEAVKQDEILTRSKVLVTFLRKKPQKNDFSNEPAGTDTISSFIVDDITDEKIEDDSDEEEEDFFESVCAICDNGGDLLCCEGKCMRSFHATKGAGSDSACESLGFSEDQVRALATFECKNCQYKQHQCFICGELGSSDKSAGPKVFQCINGTCGYFYHPHCVAEALQIEYGDDRKDLESKIAAGDPFVCPLHICHVCKEREPKDKNDLQMQFAVCRRCPRAYHRKCLPRKIAFEDNVGETIVQRAWEGLMPNKILIYCLKHKIEAELATPIRDHIKFPDTEQKKKKQTVEFVSRDMSVSKKRVNASEGATGKKAVAKQSLGTVKSFAGKKPADSSPWEERLSLPKSLKKRKLENNYKVAMNKTLAGKQKKDSAVESKTSLGSQLYALCCNESEPKGEISDLNQQRKAGKPVDKEEEDSLVLDADSKRRILSILSKAESSITLEDVAKKHKAPSTHASSFKNVIQSLTLGKMEVAIEALRAALQKLEGGGNLEDAKAVCEPALLNQIVKWKSRLRVFLAPFLHGPRYTSFGRHFTKVEKLQEIIDKLHCYVQDSDTIVDFCCGTNDFSCLMKRKLDQIGKNCGYKNYDIFPAKNDFNFEKRDWMTVRLSELPPGSKLIMGLNPPFGVNAGLANRFIEKALKFKPKLLILIAPPETLRLDEKKKDPYDLVWQDDELLRGKSFYLPGSVDVNDKQMEDWNVNVPPLSLWSRPDWTSKHKAIALENGHLHRGQEDLCMRDAPNSIPETELDYETHAVAGGPQDIEQQNEGAKVTENSTEAFGHHTGVEDPNAAHGHGKGEANYTFEEVNKNNRKRRRGRDEKSSEERRSLPRHSSPSRSGSRSLGNHLSKHPEMRSHTDIRREGYLHSDHSYSSGSQMQVQRGHVGYRGDSTGRRNSYGDEPFMGNRSAFPTGHGFMAAEEQFMGYCGDHTSSNGYRACISGINEGYAREADARAQVRMYGHQDPDSFTRRDSYFAGARAFPSSYGQHGPVGNPAYDVLNTSAIQRYAPRLDELNCTRMNNVRPMQSPYAGASGMYNQAPPPEFRRDSLSFVAGPYRPYVQQNNTSGWLNE